MPDPSLDWSTLALREQLGPLLPGLSVEVVERTVSTNSDLLERARVIGAPPCLRVAEQQTGGRGRQGRVWHSSAGASLTFSLALPLAMTDWSGLSLAVGVALADALDPAGHATRGHIGLPGATRIGLKWPNDLWLMDGADAGRKLGGILIETVAVGTRRVAVIGIGLNVQAMELGDAGSGFASLQELDTTATAPGVLQRVALPLVLALQRFEREGFGAFAGSFGARDLLRGRAVRTSQPDVPEGVAQGVSAQGALLVQTGAGLEAVTSGEVSVRLNLGAAGHALAQTQTQAQTQAQAQPQPQPQSATPPC